MFLPNFPHVNQLHEPTSDGQYDENAQMNCVATCIAASVEYLTGKAENGDDLKDAAYGQGYVGPTSPAHYADVLKARGLAITALYGPQAQLLADVKASLDRGDPVLLTIPSQWGGTDCLNWTHVVVAYGYDASNLTAMNPWGGFTQTMSQDWWTARLCYGVVYVLAKEPVVGVPTGWTDTGSELKNPINSFVVTEGFYLFVKTNPWNPDDVPVCNAFGVPEVEEGNPTLGAGDIQFFRLSGQLTYTQARNVFRTWNGQEMLALRNRPTPPPTTPPDVLTKIRGVASDLMAEASILSALR